MGKIVAEASNDLGMNAGMRAGRDQSACQPMFRVCLYRPLGPVYTRVGLLFSRTIHRKMTQHDTNRWVSAGRVAERPIAPVLKTGVG